MVKSKTKLAIERKQYFDEINNENNDVVAPEEDKEDIEIQNKQEIEENIIETSIIFREKVFNYLEKNPNPIGEFLNIENIENYFKWIIKQN